MWIIRFAEGGIIGTWPSQEHALKFRDRYLAERVTVVEEVRIVSEPYRA